MQRGGDGGRVRTNANEEAHRVNGDVAYALTHSGILAALLGPSRDGAAATRVERWVDARAPGGNAHALGVSDARVAVCADDGVVRLFAAKTLKYEGTLPKPPPQPGCQLGCQLLAAEGAAGASTDAHSARTGVRKTRVTHPAAVSCAFDVAGATLTVAYDDQRVVVWDVGDVEAGEKASKRRVEKARPLRIARAHEGGPIWGLKTTSSLRRCGSL